MPFELPHACELEYIVKKSQFITYIYPIESKEQIACHLKALKEQYPDARHICYGFLVGKHSGMSDDGEPSGTAGKPIFSILQHHDLVNTLAVVVRYFGGTKLGAGGLIRAYGQSVNQCLSQVELVEQIPKSTIEIIYNFSLENTVRHFCNQNNIEIVNFTYSERLSMTLLLASSELQLVTDRLTQICAGNVDVLVH